MYVFIVVFTVLSFVNHGNDNIMNLKVIEKCTNFYFGTEKLPPKF